MKNYFAFLTFIIFSFKNLRLRINEKLFRISRILYF
jgi:hypothetical protein